MASPFRTFRKNQKIWMAGITIMAIIAFVFFSNRCRVGTGLAAESWLLSKRNTEVLPSRKSIAFETNGDCSTNSVNLLRELLSGNQQAGGNQQAANITGAVENILGDDTDDTAIERWVYARTAEAMGVAIDDKAVNDLLTQMTMGVSEPQKLIEGVLHGVRGGITQPQLFTIMREQLLAIRLMQLGHQYDDWAGNTATQGERWDYFKRFHQKAAVEVAVLQPSSYVKDVKDPTADELKQFLDKYKEVEPSPDSPQPGFRVPRKVKIEYLESDPESYESQVTDADITKEYEKDPKRYAREKEDFEKEEKEERDARERDDKAAIKPARENKPATEPKEPTLPKNPEGNPATGSAAKSTASPPAVPDVKPDATPAAGKTPEPVKPAPIAAKPSGTSSTTPASPFRLVAYVDDKTALPAAAADKNAEQKDVAAPAAPKAAADQKAVDNKQPATESTTSAKSDAKPDSAQKDSAKKAGEAKPLDTKSSGRRSGQERRHR